MNIRDAWGFLSFGLVMGLLPMLAPSWFPPTALDGSNGRAWWLEIMGLVQTGLGGGRVLREFALPALIRWLAYAPSTLDPLPAAPVLAFESPTPGRQPALVSATDGETRVAA